MTRSEKIKKAMKQGEEGLMQEIEKQCRGLAKETEELEILGEALRRKAYRKDNEKLEDMVYELTSCIECAKDDLKRATEEVRKYNTPDAENLLSVLGERLKI